ncbi:MAG: Fic family protein [Eubacterium sp.]|nr:Fic family protein [Eubacterium sp.]
MSPNLQELIQKADSYKQKISSARPLAKEELKSLDDYFRIGFTYSSNALEGNTLTISETKILLEDGITVGGRPLKDCYEAVGHGSAYDFMLELARQQDLSITEDTIKKLHRLFYQKVDANQAGQYRSVQVYISGTEYIPPTPGEVPQLMKHLTNQIHSSWATLHPIELAAMAHKQLVDIHPFIDGNGRTARLLMNLILVNAGYGVVSIPPIFRNDYINALSASRRLNDMEPFSKLITECVIETERDYCRLLKL